MIQRLRTRTCVVVAQRFDAAHHRKPRSGAAAGPGAPANVQDRSVRIRLACGSENRRKQKDVMFIFIFIITMTRRGNIDCPTPR